MAAARHSVSDLPPLVGAVSLEPPHSGQLLINTSKSCTQAISPSRLAGGQGHTCQEEPHSEPPSKGATNHSSVNEPGEQKQTPSRPHSVTEAHTPSYHQERVVNAISANPQTGRIVHSMTPASLPVHRSHSGTLPLVKQGVAPTAPDTETCGLVYHGGHKNIQEAESHSMLACKQPMQLQQCNIITTICRGGSCGDAGVKQPRCACILSPKTASEVEEKEDQLPPNCDKALCYGSYIHQTNFEDTFAAYCHPQPIPAPSQVLPRLVESSCDIQHPVAPALALNHLTLPRLISSVSETGLDAKHLLRCCNLNCPWMVTLPHGAGPPSQKHFGLEVCCGSPGDHFRTTTRDMGTMTAKKELRDVGVQTGQATTPHVFPQICLAEESKRETSHSKTADTDRDGGKKLGGAHKSPVKEVKWDAEGMTWEVYGASVDPEELGLAIQKHLELQIKETANHATKLAQQKTNTSQQSRITGHQRKRSRMMSSIRTPACCTRTTSAVD